MKRLMTKSKRFIYFAILFFQVFANSNGQDNSLANNFAKIPSCGFKPLQKLVVCFYVA